MKHVVKQWFASRGKFNGMGKIGTLLLCGVTMLLLPGASAESPMAESLNLCVSAPHASAPCGEWALGSFTVNSANPDRIRVGANASSLCFGHSINVFVTINGTEVVNWSIPRGGSDYIEFNIFQGDHVSLGIYQFPATPCAYSNSAGAAVEVQKIPYPSGFSFKFPLF